MKSGLYVNFTVLFHLGCSRTGRVGRSIGLSRTSKCMSCINIKLYIMSTLAVFFVVRRAVAEGGGTPLREHPLRFQLMVTDEIRTDVSRFTGQEELSTRRILTVGPVRLGGNLGQASCRIQFTTAQLPENSYLVLGSGPVAGEIRRQENAAILIGRLEAQSGVSARLTCDVKTSGFYNLGFGTRPIPWSWTVRSTTMETIRTVFDSPENSLPIRFSPVYLTPHRGF